MPLYTHPYVADAGLNGIRATATNLDVLSGYTESYAGVPALVLGTQPAPTISAPSDTPDGLARFITIARPTSVVYAVAGTATHLALRDLVNSRLLVVWQLRAPFPVRLGDPITLDEAPTIVSPLYRG